MANKIHSEAREQSSLQYKNFEQLTFDNPHLVWISAKFDHFSIQRAGIKCRLMLDTYLLQIHKQKINKYKVDSICLLCHNDDEDRKHFLIQCVAFDSIRSPFLKLLHGKTTEVLKRVNLSDAIFEQTDELLSLIPDCTGYTVVSLHLDKKHLKLWAEACTLQYTLRWVKWLRLYNNCGPSRSAI